MTVPDDVGSGSLTVEGWTHPAFAEVREAFASNLRTGDELGGSVAVRPIPATPCTSRTPSPKGSWDWSWQA